jgi:NADPH-dependent 2,4-dienoyl-CoA reductase/sulfur reductase-like enzyme
MVEHTFDVVIVGGGPAGMAAAVCAAESNRRVALVDDNPAAGGQIWRRQQQNPGNGSAGEWFNRFKKAQVELFFGAQVVGHPNGGVLVAESFSDTHVIRYDKLVLAPGARERFLPFPGWTLPNVMGAGGLQALVKSGLPIRGKRVVVAGSGPLLLAVAAYLKKQGADVRLIAEQTPWLRLARFALSLWKHPAKLTQSLQLARELFGVRFVASCWPLSAQGNERLSGVALQTPSRRWTEPCDYLACGFDLVPNLELAILLGCKVEKRAVVVNQWQESSVRDVFCAGEVTGIGGVELALVEGQIAGFAAARRPEAAQQHFRRRQKLQRFARALQETFTLRTELKSLPSSDTIVCRCEDVALSSLERYRCWRQAKLQTRCGMGPCQGRICGPAAEFLWGWTVESVRPPLFPARFDSLSAGAAPVERRSEKSSSVQ